MVSRFSSPASIGYRVQTDYLRTDRSRYGLPSGSIRPPNLILYCVTMRFKFRRRGVCRNRGELFHPSTSKTDRLFHFRRRRELIFAFPLFMCASCVTMFCQTDSPHTQANIPSKRFAGLYLLYAVPVWRVPLFNPDIAVAISCHVRSVVFASLLTVRIIALVTSAVNTFIIDFFDISSKNIFEL